jgi:hypothetical protein
MYNLSGERIFNIAESAWFPGVIVHRYIHIPHSSIATEQLFQVVSSALKVESSHEERRVRSSLIATTLA